MSCCISLNSLMWVKYQRFSVDLKVVNLRILRDHHSYGNFFSAMIRHFLSRLQWLIYRLSQQTCCHSCIRQCVVWWELINTVVTVRPQCCQLSFTVLPVIIIMTCSPLFGSASENAFNFLSALCPRGILSAYCLSVYPSFVTFPTWHARVIIIVH